jgi:branched-subunit amino acid ABC-type transport system permease component
MDMLTIAFSLLYQLSDSFVLLALPALGLIIIFGMMGVVNMAHGEMMMMGAYTTAFSWHAGVALPISILFAGVVTGVFGIILERIVIRRFYGQLLSSLVVTWGVSLVMTQGALLLFGPIIRNVPTPLGNFVIGDYSYSFYRIALLAVTCALIASVWALLRFTSFGFRARATMEDAEMARALGVDVRWMYTITFGLGAMLAGIAGGMLAATSTISPFFGQGFTGQAFITVVVGGAAEIISGLLSSAISLAFVRTVFTSQFNILLGYASMLLFALVVIRFLPTGISDWIVKRRISGAVR